METQQLVSWANAIPLVTLLGVVFAAGIAFAELRAVRRELHAHDEADKEKFKELDERFSKAIAELKNDIHTSSTDQGRRIGNLEGELKAFSPLKRMLR